MEAQEIETPKETLTLTPSLRQELKKPLGILFRGVPKETMKQLAQLILKEKPECVISVGDVVSQNMLKNGIPTQVIITDNKVMRENSEPIRTPIARKVDVKNPAGTLTSETWRVVEQALSQKHPTQVLVDGEEDLLTLVAVLEAPENSLVIYGQPHEGVVAVKTDRKTKKRVQQIVDAMEPVSKKLK